MKLPPQKDVLQLHDRGRRVVQATRRIMTRPQLTLDRKSASTRALVAGLERRVADSALRPPHAARRARVA